MVFNKLSLTLAFLLWIGSKYFEATILRRPYTRAAFDQA